MLVSVKTTRCLRKLLVKCGLKIRVGREGLLAFIQSPAKWEIRTNPLYHLNPLLYWMEIPLDRGFAFVGYRVAFATCSWLASLGDLKAAAKSMRCRRLESLRSDSA